MVTTSRPFMPGYGVVPASEGSGLLPWSWAEDKLRTSHDYWLGSAWPDGRPHLMPVWGIWADGAFWFSSGSDSRKAHNLAGDPRCTVAIDDALDPVVLEGVAEVRAAEQDRLRFLAHLNAKYAVEYGLDFLDGVTALCLRVRPVTAFGLLQADFTGSPTRWTFSTVDHG
jgi:Pyridoxamine 5'-phosphate oxidase